MFLIYFFLAFPAPCQASECTAITTTVKATFTDQDKISTWFNACLDEINFEKKNTFCSKPTTINNIYLKNLFPPNLPCQVQESLSIWIQGSDVVLVLLFAIALEHKEIFQQTMPTYRKFGIKFS